MVEAHGGYLMRLESFDGLELGLLAREALACEGVEDECGLLVSADARRKVVRLAYDGAHTYGRRGARWYERHHALARLLSRASGVTVHTYVFDPEEMELVLAHGAGRPVGGERLVYSDVEVPEELDVEGDAAAFERLRARWPLGHLAQVLGLSRAELLRLPRSSSVLLSLDARGSAQRESLQALLPGGAAEPLLRPQLTGTR